MPNPVLHQARILGSVASSFLGKWRGSAALRGVAQPAKPLRLYDIEASPWCRLVREALTALHLDVEVYPCPKGGTRFRPEAERLGGKQQFPLLIDPNTGAVLYESAEIVEYLFQTYAGRPVPRMYRRTALTVPGVFAATVVRGLAGRKVRPARVPEKLLHLWSFESSPYSRLVRERLCELEIPYVLHNIGKERWQDIGPAVFRLKPGPYQPLAGGKREVHFVRTGHMQVPYLEDPNTGAKLLESAAILDYLDEVYALPR
jgi:glutathione S-transferase